MARTNKLTAAQAVEAQVDSVKLGTESAVNVANFVSFLSQEGPYIVIFAWVYLNLRSLVFTSKTEYDKWGQSMTITTVAGPAGILINPILVILAALGKLADPQKAINDAVRGWFQYQTLVGTFLVGGLVGLQAAIAGGKVVGDGPALERDIIAHEKDYEQINECIRIKVKGGATYDDARAACVNITKPKYGPAGPTVFKISRLDALAIAAVVVLTVRAIVSFVGFGRKGLS